MEETLMMNEQQPVDDKKVGKKDSWKPIAISGISGVAFGSVASAAMTATAKPSSEEMENAETALTGVSGSAYVDGSVPVAQVDDDMSFSEAFHAAHEQVGPGGVFVWHGQVYGTFTRDEWDNMTPQQQEEFGSRVHVHYEQSSHTSSQHTNHANTTAEGADAEHATPDGSSVQHGATNGAQEPLVTVVQQPTNNGGNSVVGQDVPGNVSPVEPVVEVLHFGTISNDDGSQMDLAVVSVDGLEMGLYDVNRDGVADFVAVDANNDQQIEDDEIRDISSEGLSMQSLHDAYVAQNDIAMQYPDYVNDGDIDNYMA